MDGVDLEVPPVQRSVGVVMIDFALSLRIFGRLNCKRDTAIGTEFPARVFLPCRLWMAVLIRPGLRSVLRADFLFDYQRPLRVHQHWTLQAHGVMAGKPPKTRTQNGCAED